MVSVAQKILDIRNNYTEMSVFTHIMLYFLLCCLSSFTEAATSSTDGYLGMVLYLEDKMDISEMPESQNCSSLRFYLSTWQYKQNRGHHDNQSLSQEDYFELRTGDLTSLEASGINFESCTVIFIHGFLNDVHSHVVRTMKNAADTNTNCNFIAVDYSNGEVDINYPRVASSVRAVGHCTADFINFMIKAGHPVEKIHVIGHSLGAHVSGFTGKILQTHHNIKLPRITGLDPAGPKFNGNKADARLDSSDATFLDCICTSRCLFGMCFPHCTVNYYPNGGGNIQPPCEVLDLVSFGACSHLAVVEYFAESMNPGHHFKAQVCYREGVVYDCNGALMGWPASNETRGDIWLTTNSEPPYAKEVV